MPAAEFGWHDGIWPPSPATSTASISPSAGGSRARRRPRYVNKTVLVFSIEEMAKGSFYNGYTYADTLNREATDCFIELTHEQYKARCGDRLGGPIRGHLHRRAAPRDRPLRASASPTRTARA